MTYTYCGKLKVVGVTKTPVPFSIGPASEQRESVRIMFRQSQPAPIGVHSSCKNRINVIRVQIS